MFKGLNINYDDLTEALNRAYELEANIANAKMLKKYKDLRRIVLLSHVCKVVNEDNVKLINENNDLKKKVKELSDLSTDLYFKTKESKNKKYKKLNVFDKILRKFLFKKI